MSQAISGMIFKISGFY